MSHGNNEPEAVARALALVDEGYTQHAASTITGVPASTISGHLSERDGRPRHPTGSAGSAAAPFTSRRRGPSSASARPAARAGIARAGRGGRPR
jgi:hypothetical protein